MKALLFSHPGLSGAGSARKRNSRLSPTVILLSVLACGRAAQGQTNSPPAAAAAAGPSGSTNVVKLETTTVVGKLDVARNQIVPDLGATTYTLDKTQIQALPQGANAPFNQVLLRMPGVVQDSAANGDLHVRGEHANLQYRINDVL